MELDSALVILMAETLAGLLVVALTLWLMSRRKRGKEFDAIHQFIDQLEEAAVLKNKPLDQLLTNTCGLARDQVDSILQQVTDSERALFQRVIQLFLQREMLLLSEIDQGIGELSEPYCRVISDMAAGTGKSRSASTAGGDIQTSGLERINQQLVRQLDTAMQTIDEITTEYTRVFSGQQTALELENSRKKMLQVFQDAEHKIRLNTEA